MMGQIMNPRDERNWMIPRAGTKRRKVYDALVAGKKAGEIMKDMNLTRGAFNAHRRFITSWQKANHEAYAVKNGLRTFRRVGNEFVEVHG
jgi:hypothetical protein